MSTAAEFVKGPAAAGIDPPAFAKYCSRSGRAPRRESLSAGQGLSAAASRRVPPRHTARRHPLETATSEAFGLGAIIAIRRFPSVLQTKPLGTEGFRGCAAAARRPRQRHTGRHSSARLALNRRSICRPAKSAPRHGLLTGVISSRRPPLAKSTRYSSELSCQRSATASVVPSGDQSSSQGLLADLHPAIRLGHPGPAHSVNGVISGTFQHRESQLSRIRRPCGRSLHDQSACLDLYGRPALQ